MIRIYQIKVWTSLLLYGFILCILSPIQRGLAQDQPSPTIPETRSKFLEQNNKEIYELWSDWKVTLRELTDIHFKQSRLPQQTWSNWFSENQSSNLKKIQKLTQHLLGAIKHSPAQELKSHYFSLKEQIESEKQAARDLAEDRFAAPEEGEASFWQTHRGQYDELIQRRQKAIEALKKEQLQVVADCHAFLVDLGIDLSPRQVELMFKMTSGDVMLDLFVTFAHLNLLMEVVSEQMIETQKSAAYLNTSQNYYSIYVALLILSIEVHRHTRTKLTQVDLPKVENLMKDLNQVSVNTKKMLRQEQRNARRQALPENAPLIKQLEHNLQIQKITLTASKTYKEYIRTQIREVERVERKLEHRLKIAFNTYETVRLSSSQLDLIREGMKDLSNLRKLRLPSMIPMASTEIEDQIDQIVRRLQGDLPEVSLKRTE